MTDAKKLLFNVIKRNVIVSGIQYIYWDMLGYPVYGIYWPLPLFTHYNGYFISRPIDLKLSF